MGTLAKKLMMCSGWDTEALPESVDLDGTNDYLSRASDFSGNTDGKTFTFSCWVYRAAAVGLKYLYDSEATGGIEIYISSNIFTVRAENATGTRVLVASSTVPLLPAATFLNIIISVDLSDTGKRSIYINDATTTEAWDTYLDQNIDFTKSNHAVGASIGTSGAFFGRLSNVFLDYTYRDLSIEANRRLFITEDLKPADGLSSLSPIMYMPMTDPDTWHINEGTGGNFTANGTVATSGRGPNQDNCVASVFDGTADYLSRSSIGASNGKVFTLAFITDGAPPDDYLFASNSTGAVNDEILVSVGVGGLLVQARNAANSLILNINVSPSFFPRIQYRNSAIQMSINMADQAASKIYVNGTSVAFTGTFTNDTIRFDNTVWRIGRGIISPNYFLGSIGELYFDTNYIDLSTSNPFWDSDTNLPKPVRQVLEETSATPLIAMPIEASNAGLNLGTGGDFTVNSGPFTGARGASEFWARSVDFSDGRYDYMLLDSSGVAASKTLTMMISVELPIANGRRCFHAINTALNDEYLQVSATTSGNIGIIFKNSSGTTIASGSHTPSAVGKFNTALICMDTSTSTCRMYVNGQYKNVTATLDEFVYFADNFSIAKSTLSTNNWVGSLASIYLSTDYIDFSDEDNRLLFVDGLGYPRDITQAIENGDIPTPLIHMKFDDTDALGTNSGTGGNFTVNGTVTPGADVDPNA